MEIVAFHPRIGLEGLYSKKTPPPNLPSKIIGGWPAVLFATNRTLRVTGRVPLPVVSMTTRKGIKEARVPAGTGCVNIELGARPHPRSCLPDQSGRAKNRATTK